MALYRSCLNVAQNYLMQPTKDKETGVTGKLTMTKASNRWGRESHSLGPSYL